MNLSVCSAVRTMETCILKMVTLLFPEKLGLDHYGYTGSLYWPWGAGRILRVFFFLFWMINKTHELHLPKPLCVNQRKLPIRRWRLYPQPECHELVRHCADLFPPNFLLLWMQHQY